MTQRLEFERCDDGETARKRSHQKIYVVTEGSYSDYHIVGVFDTLQGAQECPGNHNDIEVHALNYASNPPQRAQWHVEIDIDGTVTGCHMADYGGPQWSFYRKPDRVLSLWVSCFADNEDHAKRIATERWRQIIAQNLWPAKMKRGTFYWEGPWENECAGSRLSATF